ncbi:MAG TPA: class I SAM-dependent methyltransferase [Candidatus Binataceae bacterium]|nr:class I SAM-dependent methyltransferase [Candidatus Binataceae bacterium]HVB80857.1 class I SAM-dependent methyltransferase [Candidatus Binataceae bacterium]
MTPGGKFLTLDDKLYDYLLAHGHNSDPLLRELVRETQEKLGPRAGMQIAPEQGTFMTLLARAAGARRAIEVGTFTGYSAICIARGLAAGGSLLCCDVSEEWTAIARRYWEKAGVAGTITLRLAPALETLRTLPAGEVFDFAFIDADKTNYRHYYEEVLRRTRAGGLILVDNVIWSGAVLDEDDQTDDTRAIRAFNDFAATDKRVELVMLPVSDGLTIARKL